MAGHPYWSRTPSDGEMWCEGFDADLLNVVPGAIGALGDTAATELLVHARESNGKLNHPSLWHDGTFFWTPGRPDLGKPESHRTDDPVIACTFGEAVRDAWAHTIPVCVNRREVWRAGWRPFERLMYDARGWSVLEDGERDRLRRQVTESLEHAASRLRSVLAGADPEPLPPPGEADDPEPDNGEQGDGRDGWHRPGCHRTGGCRCAEEVPF